MGFFCKTFKILSCPGFLLLFNYVPRVDSIHLMYHNLHSLREFKKMILVFQKSGKQATRPGAYFLAALFSSFSFLICSALIFSFFFSLIFQILPLGYFSLFLTCSLCCLWWAQQEEGSTGFPAGSASNFSSQPHTETTFSPTDLLFLVYL